MSLDEVEALVEKSKPKTRAGIDSMLKVINDLHNRVKTLEKERGELMNLKKAQAFLQAVKSLEQDDYIGLLRLVKGTEPMILTPQLEDEPIKPETPEEEEEDTPPSPKVKKRGSYNKHRCACGKKEHHRGRCQKYNLMKSASEDKAYAAKLQADNEYMMKAREDD